jgi:hypothetical protein
MCQEDVDFDYLFGDSFQFLPSVRGPVSGLSPARNAFVILFTGRNPIHLLP